MKIRITRTVGVDVVNPRDEETWSRTLNKWDILDVVSIIPTNIDSNITLKNGDVLIAVPNDAWIQIP